MRHRLVREEDGASAVEFGIVVVLLLVIVFGIVDFGHAYFRKISLNAAVREGVRHLALGKDQGVAVAAAQDVFDATGHETFTLGTVTTCPAGGGGEARMPATFNHQFVAIGALIPPIPDSVSLQSEGVMRCGG